MIYKAKYITITVIVVAIGLFADYYYRPYIYSNNIYDFHLADTISSWACVIGAPFFSLIMQSFPKRELQVILKSILAMYLVEFIQLIPSLGTFDWYDVIATFIGSFITLGIYYRIGREKKELNTYLKKLRYLFNGYFSNRNYTTNIRELLS